MSSRYMETIAQVRRRPSPTDSVNLLSLLKLVTASGNPNNRPEEILVRWFAPVAMPPDHNTTTGLVFRHRAVSICVGTILPSSLPSVGLQQEVRFLGRQVPHGRRHVLGRTKGQSIGPACWCQN